MGYCKYFLYYLKYISLSKPDFLRSEIFYLGCATSTDKLKSIDTVKIVLLSKVKYTEGISPQLALIQKLSNVSRTVGIDFSSHTLDNKTYQIWDTVGRENFRVAINSYTTSANSCLIFADNANDVVHFQKIVQEHASKALVFIINL